MAGNATNPEVDPVLVPPMIIVLIISIMGCLGNISIIMATIRNRTLHTPCHILIAINALSETGALCGQFIFGYVVLSGINSVSLSWCWYKQLIPNIFFYSCMVLTLIIGLDRLYSILFPTIYLKRNKVGYLAIVLLIPLVYGLIWTYFSYQWMTKNPDLGISCVISDFLQGNLANIRRFEVIVMGVLMVVVYMVIWAIIKFRKNYNLSSQQKIIRSLTVIMVMVLISWPITMLLYYLVVLVAPWQLIRVLCMYVSILMNLGMSLNYIIYFIFSTDHRAAFKKQLKCLSWIPCFRKIVKNHSKANIATINQQIRPRNSVQVALKTLDF